MSEILLKEISNKLELLIALTASQGADLDTKIKILKAKGINNYEIGRLTGMNESNVRKKLKKGNNGNKKSK